nr:unnamed protein product [Digitaria exilis]
MATMESTVDWNLLPSRALRYVSDRLDDPPDFVSLRAVSPAWRQAVPEDSHRRFRPWIVETEPNDDSGSGNVLFYSPISGEYYVIHVAALEGMRTAGYGAGLLLGIDTEDDLSAVLVNPLSGVSTRLPRLPQIFHGTATYGFATDPHIITGENNNNEVVVVVYNRPAGGVPASAAMWRRGGGGGWAVMPSKTFWMRMPQIRARLLTHGPQVVEAEETAIAGMNGHAHQGHVEWLPGMHGAYVIEHEGHTRPMFGFDFISCIVHL